MAEKKVKILCLPIKKKWFDMIRSGEKKEEYREIKPYWMNRLGYWHESGEQGYWDEGFSKFPDAVCFRNGCSRDAQKFFVVTENIKFGKPKPEWSNNWNGEALIFELGTIYLTEESLLNELTKQKD